MPEVTGHCPMCEAELVVTHLRCQQCGTGLEGVFHLSRFDRLAREQLRFVEVFIKNRGVIRDVERELGISYPTVRSRLDEVIGALGYESVAPASTVEPIGTAAGDDGVAPASVPPEAGATPKEDVADRRRHLLDRLAAGEISAEETIGELRRLGQEG
ncbi:MAG: DUF2089 domain-containing protein [Chloroflexi bacterium]|nr:DUF2089 domain-containing protein [Chloroflexota bacterium]